MFYSQDTISQVKYLNDIVDVVGGYVRLEPRSGNHFGLCPFHNEKTPSFSVNRDKQIFYCFGCGAGGNVISFIKRIENMEFIDALKLLADRVHFNLPESGSNPAAAKKAAAAREICANINKAAARFFLENLYEETPDAVSARKYLEKRGVEPALMKRFGLGLSPDSFSGLERKFPEISAADFETAGLMKKSEKSAGYYDRFRGRLMFPIIDTRARVIGFGGRILDDRDEAKYINSPETALFKKSECLYGLNLAKKSRTEEMIVVEGYMDVLTMHQHGFTNTVGVLGTAMRASHARLLRNAGASTAILILDSDEAGIRAALRAIPVLVKENLKVKILQIPDAKDPDEYLSRFGAAKFSALLSEAMSHISFQVELERRKFDLKTTDGRVDFTKESAKIIASLTSFIEIDAHVKEIAKATDISAEAIHREVEKITGESREKSAFLLSPRRRVLRAAGEDMGLKNAKKTLISLLFSEPDTARFFSENEFLKSKEIGDDVFAKILDFALANTQDKPFSPSDLLDFFEEDEEQQLIAEIFSETRNFESRAAVFRTLTDCVKKIKLSYLNNCIEREKNDLNAVNSILSEIRNVNSLNITFA